MKMLRGHSRERVPRICGNDANEAHRLDFRSEECYILLFNPDPSGKPDKQKRYVTMRLRNFFPATAFFLTFGVAFAFALEPVDENTRRETIYPFRYPASAESNNIFVQYFFDKTGNKTLTIKLIPYKSITEAEDAWSFHTSEHIFNNSTNTPSDEDLPLSDDRIPQSDTESIPTEAEATAPTAKRVVDEDRVPVYVFSIPFDDSISEEMGFTGSQDSDDENELSFLKDEFKESKDSQLSDNGLYSSLVFNKKAYLNSPNSTHILFGGDYGKSFKKKDDDAGISFSTPVALFFLTLGAGIVLVMYTATGKNEN